MLYRKSSSKFLQKCFGYLQNISYICSLKSLGKNINLRNIMNITLLKKSGTKEVINRLTLDGLVAAIREGEVQTTVKKFREVYHLMKVERLDDGQESGTAGRRTNYDELGGWRPHA